MRPSRWAPRRLWVDHGIWAAIVSSSTGLHQRWGTAMGLSRDPQHPASPVMLSHPEPCYMPQSVRQTTPKGQIRVLERSASPKLPGSLSPAGSGWIRQCPARAQLAELMAGKRGASSDLNHDNWDHEEEPEVAGNFAQASDEDLKGRIIRKAKRRGLTAGDGQPSVFSTFAGFGQSKAAPAAPTTGAFDFLKPASSTPVPAEGANGKSPSSGGQPSLKGFGGFGVASDGQRWTCSACMVPNVADVTSCACCSSPKPSGDAPSSAAAPPVTTVASSLTGFGGFGAAATGSKWSCSECMVSNSAEDEACVCCSNPKPGSKKKADGASSLFGSSSGAPMAIPPGGGFKFGSTATTSSSTSSTSGFKFGATSSVTSSATTKSPASGFTFGSSSGSTPAKAGSPGSGFKFGASTSATTPSAGFSFGSKAKQGPTSSPPATGFAFGSQANDSGSKPSPKSPTTATLANAYSDEYCHQLKTLNKQIAEWIKKHVDNDPYVLLTPIFGDYERYLKEMEPLKKSPKKAEPAEEARPFKTTALATSTKSDESRPLLGAVFGKKPEEKKVEPEAPKPKSSGITFGSPTPSDKYGAESKASEAAGLFSFGRSAALTTSTSTFSFGSTSKSEERTTSTFSFGSSASKPSLGSGSRTSSGFSFGEPSKPTATGFSFGSTPSTPSAGFSFATAAATAATNAAKESGGGNQGEEDESDEPPKVEVKTIEEDGAKYSVRCKLFYKSGSEFKDKGLGMLHLKEVEDGKKTQMVVRAETNLGNILLNILVTKKINATQRANNVQFVCIPNPEIKGVEPGPLPMLVKVKTADMAKELVSKLDEAAA